MINDAIVCIKKYLTTGRVTELSRAIWILDYFISNIHNTGGCDSCVYFAELPEAEQQRWWRPETLCYCTKIPQAVNRNARCSDWRD